MHFSDHHFKEIICLSSSTCASPCIAEGFVGYGMAGIFGGFSIWSQLCLLVWYGVMVAASPAGSPSIVGFLLGATISWTGGVFQRWWQGPVCYSVPAEQFASLRPCNDCSYDKEQVTSTTTTSVPAGPLNLVGDFWWWIRWAMLCGAFFSFGLCLVIGLLVRWCLGSNAVGSDSRPSAIMDAAVRREIQSTAVVAASELSQVLALPAPSKEETARAQVAFIRGRLDSLPVPE